VTESLQAGGVFIEVSVRSDGVARGMRQAEQVVETSARNIEQSASGIQKALQTALGMFGIGMGMQAVQQVAGWAEGLMRMGAAADRMETSFEALGGSNAPEMLEKLRVASKGTISDYDLMASANRALMLGVATDADTMSKLLETAMARGRAMGLSTADAFDQIITGIGRMSPEILDNLGIITGGQQAFDDYAKSIGKATDALSAQEKQQFLIQKVMQDTTTLALQQKDALDSAARMEQMQAAKQNLQEGLGKSLAGSGLVIGAENVVSGAMNAVGNYFGNIAESRKYMDSVADGLIELHNAGKIADEQFAEMELQWQALDQKASWLGQGIDTVTQEWQKVLDANPEVKAALQAQRDETNRYAAAMEYAKSAVQEFADEEIRLKLHTGQSTPELYKAPPTQQQGIQRARAYTNGLTGYETSNMLQALWDKDQQDKTDAAKKTQQEADQAQRDAEAQAEKEAQDFRNTIEGLLMPTQVTGEDIYLTRIGKYTNKWDEYIRELKSAATDAKSQWKYLIPTDILAQGQDAMQAYEAQQERLFYSGQLPDKIDWGGAPGQGGFLDALRAQIAAQQAKEAMIRTAIQKANEAGINASNAAVEQALGVKQTPGDQVAAALNTAVNETDLGKPITDAFDKQLQGEQQRWIDLGKKSIAWFVQGTEDGISPTAGRKIAEKLFPYFADLLNRKEPRN